MKELTCAGCCREQPGLWGTAEPPECFPVLQGTCSPAAPLHTVMPGMYLPQTVLQMNKLPVLCHWEVGPGCLHPFDQQMLVWNRRGRNGESC